MALILTKEISLAWSVTSFKACLRTHIFMEKLTLLPFIFFKDLISLIAFVKHVLICNREVFIGIYILLHILQPFFGQVTFF